MDSNRIHNIYRRVLVCIALISLSGVIGAFAQQPIPRSQQRRERIQVAQTTDSTDVDLQMADSIARENKAQMEDMEAPIKSTELATDIKDVDLPDESVIKEEKQFIPDPARATWMAVIFPGGGQIYNRKYWKLPIIYGGFVGCAYALTWNGQMYSDYSQAYLDIMDDNPSTDSFLDLLPPGYPVESNMDYLKRVIKRKKDYYRRYRDMSIFIFVGVYAISVIDAYVDAELASFDLSKDLTMKLEPTMIPNNRYDMRQGNSYGLQCSFRF